MSSHASAPSTVTIVIDYDTLTLNSSGNLWGLIHVVIDDTAFPWEAFDDFIGFVLTMWLDVLLDEESPVLDLDFMDNSETLRLRRPSAGDVWQGECTRRGRSDEALCRFTVSLDALRNHLYDVTARVLAICDNPTWFEQHKGKITPYSLSPAPRTIVHRVLRQRRLIQQAARQFHIMRSLHAELGHKIGRL